MGLKGGVSLTTGKQTESDNYITYYLGAKYTHYMDIGNYIPSGGRLEIKMPSQVKIMSNPFSQFSSSDANLV
jgi:hypothetical protein